jgi:hypothetical protein
MDLRSTVVEADLLRNTLAFLSFHLQLMSMVRDGHGLDAVWDIHV